MLQTPAIARPLTSYYGQGEVFVSRDQIMLEFRSYSVATMSL